MLTIVMSFSTTLTARLDKADLTLPLSKKDEDTLKALLPDGGYTYLVIRDMMGAEVIKVENTCGSLLITRGEDDTEPRNFPKGACIRYETVPAVVKDLICNYDCCADTPCPCNKVVAEGISLSAGSTGKPWSGSAVFSGDLPMAVAASGYPSWVQVEVGANYVAFSGTPTDAGTFTISAAATNCEGQVAVQQGTFTIS